MTLNNIYAVSSWAISFKYNLIHSSPSFGNEVPDTLL